MADYPARGRQVEGVELKVMAGRKERGGGTKREGWGGNGDAVENRKGGVEVEMVGLGGKGMGTRWEERAPYCLF